MAPRAPLQPNAPKSTCVRPVIAIVVRGRSVPHFSRLVFEFGAANWYKKAQRTQLEIAPMRQHTLRSILTLLAFGVCALPAVEKGTSQAETAKVGDHHRVLVELFTSQG